MVNAVTMTTTGPLFQGKGPAFIRQAGEGAVKQLVELGENRLAQTLKPRPAGVYLTVSQAKKGKHSKGQYRLNLHSKTTGMEGLITDGGVIYGPWLEGVGSRNATTRFKGYFSFRRTGQWLQKQARRVMQTRVAKAVGRLNGI